MRRKSGAWWAIRWQLPGLARQGPVEFPKGAGKQETSQPCPPDAIQHQSLGLWSIVRRWGFTARPDRRTNGENDKIPRQSGQGTDAGQAYSIRAFVLRGRPGNRRAAALQGLYLQAGQASGRGLDAKDHGPDRPPARSRTGKAAAGQRNARAAQPGGRHARLVLVSVARAGPWHGATRLEAGLNALSRGTLPAPRLADLSAIVSRHGREILSATIGTRVSPGVGPGSDLGRIGREGECGQPCGSLGADAADAGHGRTIRGF